MSKNFKTKYDTFTPPEFEWPEFNSESERIKAYSKKFENVSIAEAFNKVYKAGVNIKDLESDEYKASEYSNTHPVSVGDMIDVTIENLNGRDALISYHNSKDQLVLKQNVSGWNLTPGEIIKASVMSKNNGKYIIDCIEPLYQGWISRVSSTLKNQFQSYQCTVKDLQRGPGGYTGKIEIPEITSLTGKPYLIDAFIPGSYIALNIEKDFEKWNGATVDAMITNFTSKNGVFSAVCSRKKLLNVAGGTSLVNIFDAGYGRGTRFEQMTFDGVVTGIINSAKKHGVFVEIPEYNITGMIEKNPIDLVKYHEGDAVKVQLDKFDWDQKKQPYRRNRDGVLTEVNLKPIFVEV